MREKEAMREKEVMKEWRNGRKNRERIQRRIRRKGRVGEGEKEERGIYISNTCSH